MTRRWSPDQEYALAQSWLEINMTPTVAHYHMDNMLWSEIRNEFIRRLSLNRTEWSDDSIKRTGSPCGACKFLRRKCVKGCVFAPFFCHEQGATHFSAIHRVFGASNVSKLLANLPICDRSEAAVTIAYEAQARLQDPIYGCVSHIFALQQQVVSLQSQILSLREQAPQRNLNVPICSDNININPINVRQYYPSNYQQTQDIKNWFDQSENSWTHLAQFNPNSTNNAMNFKSMAENYKYSLRKDEDGSFSSFEEGSSYSIDSLEMQIISRNQQQWGFRDNGEDLQSVAFGFHN